MINDVTGFAPPSWQGRLGDCIVGRKDGKDLSVDVLSAIVDYVSRLLDSIGDYGSINREKWLNPDNFYKYLKRGAPDVAEDVIRSPAASAGPATSAPATASSSSAPQPPPSSTAPLHPSLQAALSAASAAKDLGNTAFRAEDFQTAFAHYEAGIKALTDFLTAGIGSHVANLDATKHIFHALALNQAFCCQQEGCFPDAIKRADMAIDIHHLGFGNREMAKAYYRRGMAKAMLEQCISGEMEAGREDLEKAVELAPGDEGIRMALRALDE